MPDLSMELVIVPSVQTGRFDVLRAVGKIQRLTGDQLDRVIALALEAGDTVLYDVRQDQRRAA